MDSAIIHQSMTSMDSVCSQNSCGISLPIILEEVFRPIATVINKFFCNPCNTPMSQFMFAIFWGILFSPWSSGLFYLFAFGIFYELAYYIFTKGDPCYYNVFVRTAVNCAAVFGYIIGRTLTGDDILDEGEF